MNKRFRMICAIATICANTWAQEQPIDTTEIQVLEEVIVSDTRSPIKRENSGKTVIKITAEELQRSQGKTVAEIITTKSGIELSGSRGRQGEILGVFARGGRGKQVIVLIDGVRVSDPSSFSQEYDLRLLNTAAIERVDIIKGASSTLYGANAATAVIQITTKQYSSRKIQGNFQSSIGTNQTASDQDYGLHDFTNSLLVNGTLDKFSYSVGFNNRYSDGLSSLITPENEEDPFSTISTDLKVGYRFNEDFNISFYGNQTKLRSSYDESFGLVDAPYSFLSEQKRLGMASKLSYGAGTLTVNAAATSYASENISAFPGTYEGNNIVVDIFNTYKINDLYTLVGINYSRDKTQFETDKDFSIVDPYLTMVYTAPSGLNLNLGGRLNNHSEYGSQFVYNINPSFTMKNAQGYFKLLGTYATSYITPTLTQLFGQFGANPLLEPETNRTIEGGLEYSISNKIRANVVYFDRKEENFVFFDNSSFLYGNAEGIINANGLELELDWNLSEQLQVQANYTFTERTGDTAIRIPKHKLNTNLSYQVSDKYFVGLNYTFVGERPDTDFNTFEEVTLDAYSLVGCYMSLQLLPEKLQIFLNADNLLNQDFTEVLGFTTRGRNVRVGINLTL
ncbi:MAG: TonB-dependent receptor [Muriicola sp.]|nr:TonB-dependent receptor [Muriicola sp.]